MHRKPTKSSAKKVKLALLEITHPSDAVDFGPKWRRAEGFLRYSAIANLSKLQAPDVPLTSCSAL
jgi:hypothetical protein